MRSIFSLRALIPIFMLLPLSLLLGVISKITIRDFESSPAMLLAVVLIFFFWLWIVFGELRRRVVGVELMKDRIIVRQFAGLAGSKTYYFDELDGYIINILPSRSGSYEYLFIQQGGRRVIRLSEFYHRNYAELKTFIEKKLKGHNTHTYSLASELRDIFG